MQFGASQIQTGLHLRDRQASVSIVKSLQHGLHMLLGRKRAADEEISDLVVFLTVQEDSVRLFNRSPGSADLLVVVDDRRRALKVDNETKIGLIESHSQGDRGNKYL